MPTPAEIILAKAPLPTHLDSEGIKAALSASLRRRAFYSAKTAEMGYLKRIQRICAQFAAGETDAASARAGMLGWLDQTGYSSEGTRGIEDLASRRRLDLILKTQREMAANAARVQSETPATVEAYPAWRLERYMGRRIPREDWAARWAAAGDAVGWEGALKWPMVALKNSLVWQALGSGAGGFRDTLGNPFPPFAYSSGLSWKPVAADECRRLGLDIATAAPGKADLTPGEREIVDAMQTFGKGFAADLEKELEALA